MASNEKILDELEAANRRAKSTKERAAKKAEEVVDMAGAILGGGVGGALDAKYPNKKIAGVGLGMLAGATACAVSLLGYGGKANGFIGNTGAGLLAWEFGKAMHARLSTQGTSGVAGALGSRPANLHDLRSQLGELARG